MLNRIPRIINMEVDSMSNKKERRTKMMSPTFTTEEYKALEKAAKYTDRSLGGVVRWATIKYLREIGELPEPGITDADDEEKEE